MSELTSLIGPDGNRYEVASDNAAALKQALAKGYRLETEAAPRTALEAVKSGAGDVAATSGAVTAGGLSGLTAGLSDAAMAYARPDLRPELLAQKEDYPFAHGVGEFAGMVASPLNAVGGEATKAIGATSKLGRIGAQAVGGSAVGSLYGAGNAVSEAALGDHQLTAESLISGAGLGALLGGAGGGFGGVLDEAAGKLIPKLGKSIGGAQESLEELANSSALKATRATQNDILKLGEEKAAAAGEALRSRGHVTAMSTPADIVESVAKDLSATGATKGAFLDAAEAMGPLKAPNTTAFKARINEFEAGLNPMERKAIASDIQDARQTFEEIGSRSMGDTGKQGSSWRAVDDAKQTIQAKAKFSKGPVPLDDVTFGLKRQLAGVVRDELDRQLIPVLGKDAAAFMESKATYAALKDATRLAERGAAKAGGFGLKDLLVGGIGGSLHPAGIVSAVASKFYRDHGAAIASVLADKIAKSPTLATVAASFAKSFTKAPHLGQYLAPLALTAGLDPPHQLAQHIVAAQADPHYARMSAQAGFRPEIADEHGASLAKAHSIASIAAASVAHTDAIDRHIDAVFRGTKSPPPPAAMNSQDFGSKRMRRESADAHDKRVEEIRALAADPQALLDRTTANIGNLANVAPDVASQLVATANRAVQYLAAQAQVPPKAGPLATDWVTPEADRHEFAEKLEVIQDPLRLLRDMAAGIATTVQFEALQAVYPTLARSISDKVLERMVAAPMEVPYKARLMLGLLTGIDVDGSMSTAAIASNQMAIHAGGDQQKQDEAQPSGSRSSSMTLAQRTALPNQQREAEA